MKKEEENKEHCYQGVYTLSLKLNCPSICAKRLNTNSFSTITEPKADKVENWHGFFSTITEPKARTK